MGANISSSWMEHISQSDPPSAEHPDDEDDEDEEAIFHSALYRLAGGDSFVWVPALKFLWAYSFRFSISLSTLPDWLDELLRRREDAIWSIESGVPTGQLTIPGTRAVFSKGWGRYEGLINNCDSRASLFVEYSSILLKPTLQCDELNDALL